MFNNFNREILKQITIQRRHFFDFFIALNKIK
jgi:hypothetical protein